MKAAIFGGPRNLVVGERPDPMIEEPSDAIVRVTLSCVCGSDLWYCRGLSPHDLGAIGHEFVGIVDDVGADVRGPWRAP
jgi:threonine dehydrogenase-like Zn-dependent dehydrogenase